MREEAEREKRRLEMQLMRERELLERQLDAVRVGNGRVVFDLPGIAWPDTWTSMPSHVDSQRVAVPQHSDEYFTIAAHFHEGSPHAQIVRIWRNQSRSLWTWFFLRRSEIEAKLAAHGVYDVNERELFHGSRTDAIDIILDKGFDHRVANLQGALGAGTYFATSSATSRGFLRSRHDVKRMLVCRVVLGSVGNGSNGLR